MNMNFNLPPGCIIGDIDPPQICECCGERVQGDGLFNEETGQTLCEDCFNAQIKPATGE